MNNTDGAAVVPAIRLEHVTKRYPGSDAPAVDALDLDVPVGRAGRDGGPVGMWQDHDPQDGEPPASRRRAAASSSTGSTPPPSPSTSCAAGIGYVIQQVGLFPHRTIRDNIATVPSLLGWDKQRTQARVDELCELVGLDPDVLRRYPAALSGGQQQRVGVARALAADPPVLLMDEPYSAVDPVVRARLQDDLIDLQRRLHKTILLVTHDIDEAIKLADRVALLNVGGVLEQYGPPDELLRAPASAFVEGFLGNDRALKRLSRLTVADLADDALEPAIGRRPGTAAPGRDLTLRDALDALLGLGERPAPRARRRRSGPRHAHGRRHRRASAMMAVLLGNDADSFIWWDWVSRNSDKIWDATVEHLQLTLLTVSIGVVLSSMLTAVALRFKVTATPILWAIGARVHDPEHRPVRLPRPPPGPRLPDGARRPRRLHARHPGAEHGRRHRGRARHRSAKRRRPWGSSRGGASGRSSSRSPSRRSWRASASPPSAPSGSSPSPPSSAKAGMEP